MFSGLKVGFQLSFGFWRGQKLELRIGVLEGGRVPFLARRLILLIVFVTLAIELLTIPHVKIASTTAICFAADFINA